MKALTIRVWLEHWLEGWRSCRACGARVRPWDDICKHCGAGGPVEVSCFQAVLLTAVAAEAVLVLLR